MGRAPFNNFINLFNFGSAGSLMLHKLFSSCGAQVSLCGGASCCGARALGHVSCRRCGSQALEHRLDSCGAQA